jgi:tight adherence protein B
MTGGRRLLAVGLAVGVAVLSSASVAVAADPQARIVSNSRAGSTLSLVFRADGLPATTRIDPASVSVTVDGKKVDSQVKDQGTSGTTTRVVLAIDTSHSMAAGGKIDAAKAAAHTFLNSLPATVEVGLVTFGDSAQVTLPPTPDHATAAAEIDKLQVGTKIGTALYDGAAYAIDQAAGVDAPSVLVLSDGQEFGNSTTTQDDVVTKAGAAHVAIDAVYIGTGAAPASLAGLTTPTNGTLVSATTADLSQLFKERAAAISSQILITATLPDTVGPSAKVVVTAQAGATPLTGSATNFYSGQPAAPSIAPPIPVKENSAATLVDKATLPYVLGALFLGLLVIVYVALGTVRRDEKQGRVRRRLSIYTLTGRAPVKQEETTTALGSSQVARSAVEFAGRVVKQRDFEGALALRLEAAGLPLRAAEWMLIHVAVAIGAAIILLLISGGKIIPTLIGLVLGLVLPWVYLGFKEGRRTSAFLAQLPDTLQMIAGSLSAGYSMPQAIDTVVREGSQPISGEFNRALVEARLGVPIEDAMEGIADRMKSRDFAWVVMAIRIQREVGGNLAELLTTVSNTLRERETLRRQVRVLSAEGRLSAWILGLLPIVFALYLVIAQPKYLKPLVSEALGWFLIVIGVVLLTVGALWMRKAVKVEV